jgi:hypothetical protein
MTGAPSMLAIYDGRSCVGFILARGKRATITAMHTEVAPEVSRLLAGWAHP